MSRRAQHGVLAVLVCVVIVGQALFAAVPAPIGTVHLTPGWATFGQAVPQGLAPAGASLQIGSLVTQVDVKNRWPDLSIKFAILTAKVAAEDDYAITVAAASTGGFVPVPRNVTVDLSINGSPYRAIVPAAPGDYWLKGPLVVDSRHVVAPVDSSALAHPFLRVLFDMRYYENGAARADVTVENVLNLQGASTVKYDVDIAVDGIASFSQDDVEHFYLTRWRHAKSIGNFSTVTPDIASLHTTRALPPYLALVPNQVDEPLGETYGILKSGALESNMPAHGGRQELAPYPDWVARYLVHKNSTQKSFILTNGDLAGSWPVHAREPEGGGTVPYAAEGDPLSGVHHVGVGSERLISLAQRPSFWYDARGEGGVINDGTDTPLDFIQGSPLPIVEYGDIEPGPGQSALIPDNAHQPSIAYVPYLLTGDRYYADEMGLWANYAMLRTYPGNGARGANGLLGDQETRAFGWSLRNLADAAAYYPDASPVKQYLVDRVVANLQSLDDLINSLDTATNPLKIFRPDYRNDIIEGPPHVGFMALWEHTYLAYAIDRANHHGFSGGKLARDAVAELQLKLFTSDEYPRQTTLAADVVFDDGSSLPAGTVLDWGAPYLLAIAHVEDAFTWGAGYTLFTSMQQIADATTAGPFYLDRQRPYPGYYGPEARLNLMMGIENYEMTGDGRWSRSQEAYDYLFPFIGVNLEGCEGPDLACRPGWAVGPYPAYEPPGGGGTSDGDDDGVADVDDNCPAVANPDQADLDGDGTGDVCDGDRDGDGVDNGADAFPDDPSESVDTDGDHTGNNADLDDDGDHQSDVDEAACGSDPLNAGSTSADLDHDNRPDCVDPDRDGDGVENDADAFPNDPAESVDTDHDGLGDNADDDDDGDGRKDGVDPFPLIPNRAPTIVSPGDQASTIGVAITALPVSAGDLDGDGLTWSQTGLPAGFTLSNIGAITGAAGAGTAGTHDVTITVSDGLLAASTAFKWTVNNTGTGGGVVVDTPAVDITFDNVTQPGLTQVAAADPPTEGEVPAGFSVAGLPAYEITTTAQFSGPIVVCFDVSSLNLDQVQFDLLRVLHGEGGAFVDRTILPPDTPAPDFATQTICARVTSLSPFALAKKVNIAPELHVTPPPAATVGVAIAALPIGATDADGDALTLTVTGLPPGLDFSQSTHEISGTPTLEGSFPVTVTLSDGTASVTDSFTWVVNPPNVEVSLVPPGPQSNTEGDRVTLQLQWTGNPTRVRFSASGLPHGLHIRRDTGAITGRISRRGEGTYDVTVTLRADGKTMSETFVWTVLPMNHPPRLRKIADQNSKVGEDVDVRLKAFDRDGDKLEFTAVNLPPGVSLKDGCLTGVVGGPGGKYSVQVTVSDGRASATQSFDWTVVLPKKKETPKKK